MRLEMGRNWVGDCGGKLPTLCLEENDRRFADYDTRRLRPQTIRRSCALRCASCPAKNSRQLPSSNSGQARAPRCR
jgi:hypothetical protein